ncbi:hypothetical protein RJ55_04365 [Drechmeria coniospora]|nr:hypothetical protein RJ55_04365 [Drechmeria coniospora]
MQASAPSVLHVVKSFPVSAEVPQSTVQNCDGPLPAGCWDAGTLGLCIVVQAVITARRIIQHRAYGTPCMHGICATPPAEIAGSNKTDVPDHSDAEVGYQCSAPLATRTPPPYLQHDYLCCYPVPQTSSRVQKGHLCQLSKTLQGKESASCTEYLPALYMYRTCARYWVPRVKPEDAAGPITRSTTSPYLPCNGCHPALPKKQRSGGCPTAMAGWSWVALLGTSIFGKDNRVLPRRRDGYRLRRCLPAREWFSSWQGNETETNGQAGAPRALVASCQDGDVAQLGLHSAAPSSAKRNKKRRMRVTGFLATDMTMRQDKKRNGFLAWSLCVNLPCSRWQCNGTNFHCFSSTSISSVRINIRRSPAALPLNRVRNALPMDDTPMDRRRKTSLSSPPVHPPVVLGWPENEIAVPPPPGRVRNPTTAGMGMACRRGATGADDVDEKLARGQRDAPLPVSADGNQCKGKPAHACVSTLRRRHDSHLLRMTRLGTFLPPFESSFCACCAVAPRHLANSVAGCMSSYARHPYRANGHAPSQQRVTYHPGPNGRTDVHVRQVTRRPTTASACLFSFPIAPAQAIGCRRELFGNSPVGAAQSIDVLLTWHTKNTRMSRGWHRVVIMKGTQVWSEKGALCRHEPSHAPASEWPSFAPAIS